METELMHRIAGTTWKVHKYIKKDNGRYVYPAKSYAEAEAISQPGDTIIDPEGHQYVKVGTPDETSSYATTKSKKFGSPSKSTSAKIADTIKKVGSVTLNSAKKIGSSTLKIIGSAINSVRNTEVETETVTVTKKRLVIGGKKKK